MSPGCRSAGRVLWIPTSRHAGYVCSRCWTTASTSSGASLRTCARHCSTTWAYCPRSAGLRRRPAAAPVCIAPRPIRNSALKLARAHAGLLRSEGVNIGTKFLALEQSFHGRTFGSISTTYKEKYREPFGPVVPGVEFVRFNDIDDLRAKFSTDVCAILLEAIQGEGGVRPLTQEFFAEARALATSTGALLIVDEIQSGMGRTGKWCAYQHYGIQPDVTTLAKPL